MADGAGWLIGIALVAVLVLFVVVLSLESLFVVVFFW